MRFPKGDQAIRAVIESPLVRLSCLLALSGFVGLRVARLNSTTILLTIAGIAALICLIKIKWAVCLLIFLSPFHYAIKELSPSVLMDVWRETFLIIILWFCVLQVLLRRRPLPPKKLLNYVLIAYLIWGVAEIFNSANLVVGVAGFRFMFSFVPLYFVAMSTIDDETDVKRLMKAILASGVIVGAIAIIQFVFVSLLGIVEKGTSFDFARNYATDSYRAAGIPWDRANSILVGPNELGVFLAACLTLTFSYYLVKEKPAYPWLFRAAMVIMGSGLLVSMSRSAMIGLAVAWCALGIVKGRAIKPVLVLGGVIVVLLALAPFIFVPLFEPVVTFSDDYFTQTLTARLSPTTLLESPILGQGYGLTPSAIAALGIRDPSVLRLGGLDIYVIQSIVQIGVIGFSLFFMAWFLFLKDAYLGAVNAGRSDFQRNTAAGIFATLIGVMVTSAHVAAWDYASFGASYYLLGAIATKISVAAKRETVRPRRT